MKKKINLVPIILSVAALGLFVLNIYQNEGKVDYYYLLVSAGLFLIGFKNYLLTKIYYPLLTLIIIGFIVYMILYIL